MGKVVTSQGLNEFVTEGKTEVVNVSAGNSAAGTESAGSKANAAAGKAAPAATESAVGDAVAEVVAEASKASNKGQSTEDLVKELGLDKEFSAEELKTIGERVTRSMAQRHRRMKEAQEAAAEAERFAETQFNEKRQVEREREELRSRLEAAEKARPNAPEKPKEPVIDDFKDDKGNVDWVKFVDARSEWRANEAVAKDRAERERVQQEAAKAAAELEARARFQKAKERYPDFEEVMARAGETLIQQAVLDYLTESEQGPDLTYYLINHPEEVERIKRLSPTAALAAVGKLETKIEGELRGDQPSNGSTSQSTRAEKGGAPAPITPLGVGSGIVPKDPTKMTFKELRAYERQREQEKRARH